MNDGAERSSGCPDTSTRTAPASRGATGNRPCLAGEPARPDTGAERDRRRATQNQQQDRSIETRPLRALCPFEPDAAPALALTAPSAISSIPAASSAPISFISESTLPRITPSLASMRWIVGTDRPDSSASPRWSMPSRARAARSCAAVITYET